MKTKYLYLAALCCVCFVFVAYADNNNDESKLFNLKYSKVGTPGAKSQEHSRTKDLKKKNSFEGSKVALGYVANTGNTDSKNFNMGGLLNYTHQRWNLSELTTYERQSDDEDALIQDKLYTQGRVQYALNAKDYIYSQVSYLNNPFDGYTYVYNENLGYGRYFPMPPTMSFDVFLGPGMRQGRVISAAGGTFTNKPAMQIGGEYLWDFSQTGTLNLNTQTETSPENTHVESNAGVMIFIIKHLALNLNYNVGYDTKPVVGKAPVNTTTTLQLLYNF